MKLLKIGDIILNLNGFDIIKLEDHSVRFKNIKENRIIELTFSTDPKEASTNAMIVKEDDLDTMKNILEDWSYVVDWL